MKKIRGVDSTRYKTTFYCPAERFWHSEFMGRGIVPTGMSEDLMYGLALHRGCELIASGKSLGEAYAEGRKELVGLSTALTPDGLAQLDELSSLLYGHLRVYFEYIYQMILDQFEIIAVEQEFLIPLAPDLIWMTRLDKVLRRLSDDAFFNMNYKTSAYLNDLYSNVEHDIQLIMEAVAVGMFAKTDMAGSLVLGFDKGRKQAVSDAEKKLGLAGKRLLSPFTYGYRKEGNYSCAYKRGWDRFPVWTEMPREAWYEQNVPEDTRTGSYSLLTPIFHAPDVIERIKKQIVTTETWIDSLGESFYSYPQATKNCNQHAGFIHMTCPYKGLCWGGTNVVDVLGDTFQWRPINHPHERDLLPPAVKWVEGDNHNETTTTNYYVGFSDCSEPA